jgi:hypothetical protein
MNSRQGGASRKENNDSRNAGSFVQEHTSEQIRFDFSRKTASAQSRGRLVSMPDNVAG